MLTKKESVLIKPWQDRRYLNHRKKVQTAVPAIDNAPPLHREHVALKPKRSQKEIERNLKIEQENLKILQKLAYIMRTNKIDNRWNSPQPNFLNRIKMYQPKRPEKLKVENTSVEQIDKESINTSLRRKICSACTPMRQSEEIQREERVPWDPPKLTAERKSQSLPSLWPEPGQKCQDLPRREIKPPKINIEKQKKLVLNMNECKVVVNFPPDIMIRIRDQKTGKLLKGS